MKPAKICCDPLDAHCGFEALFWGLGEQPPFMTVENLLRLAKSSFSNVEVFEDVLGGTAAPYTRRVWGAVIFLIKNGSQI